MSTRSRRLVVLYSNDSLIVGMLYMHIIQPVILDVVLDLHFSSPVTVVAEEAQPAEVAPSNRLVMFILCMLVIYDRYTLLLQLFLL